MSKKEDKPSDIELGKMFADIRNGLQTAVEAIDAYLNFISKAELHEWDPTKFQWLPQPGTDRGPYEKAHSDDTTDFKAMIEDLKKHGGKLTWQGVFYWLFGDEKTVGRKKIALKGANK